MAVITSAGTGNTNDGATWSSDPAVPGAGDDVVIQNTHTVTANGGNTWNSLTVLSGGTFNGNTETITIDGEADGSGDTTDGYAINIDGAISGSTTDIEITTAGTTLVDLVPSSGTIRDLTINHDEAIVRNVGSPTISGDLTITDGTFKNNTGTDNLTVTGDVLISDGGRLEGENNIGTSQFNTFGSLTIASGGTYWATSGVTTITDETGGAAYHNNGTFTHNDGTLLLDSIGNTEFFAGSSSLYNLTSSTGNVVWLKENLTVANDLTVTSGSFGSYGANSRTITVTGDVSVTGGQLGNGSETGAYSFGSLTIASGGTYSATSGTTTITGGFRPADVAGTLTLNGGAWAFGGTGGLFEGDLLKNEREVRINQERIFNFDGSDGNINCGADSSLALAGSDFTISMWFKTDTLGAGRVLFNQGAESDTSDDLHLILRDSNVLSLAFYADDLNSTTAIVADKWYHVAFVYDEGTRLQSIYLDGVLDTSRTATAQFAGTAQTYIGKYYNDSSHFDGNIVDVRVYKKVLDGGTTTVGANTTGSLAKLASKMLVGVGAPNNWWKLNDETASGGGAGTGYVKDFGTANQQGTMDTLTWVYDAFGVDIQDNTTTVGNLIVESGQLNTKALVYPDFDGADDYITVTDADSLDGMGALTISAWVKPTDAGDSTQQIIDKKYDSAYSLSLNRGSNDYYYMYVNYTTIATTTGSATYGAWQHVVMTYDSTGSGTGRLYLNGVLNVEDTSFSGAAVGANSENLIIGGRYDLAGSARWDGGLRDIKMFKQALSADQVASLYSGSFNVTPAHWWKMDGTEGVADDSAVEDYGTGTDADGVGVSLAWTDGSLKVNGAARVLDNGSVVG